MNASMTMFGAAVLAAVAPFGVGMLSGSVRTWPNGQYRKCTEDLASPNRSMASHRSSSRHATLHSVCCDHSIGF